jgi:PhnB protein
MTATGVEPELWVDRAAEAVDFYAAAFGASTLLRVGDGDDLVARLEIGAARFWVAAASAPMSRFSPLAIQGRTSRTLLVVDDPDGLVSRAVGAGATLTSAVGEEHGWRLGRIVDPYGHEWEIGRPSS